VQGEERAALLKNKIKSKNKPLPPNLLRDAWARTEPRCKKTETTDALCLVCLPHGALSQDSSPWWQPAKNKLLLFGGSLWWQPAKKKKHTRCTVAR
jgi:hypothetical protein